VLAGRRDELARQFGGGHASRQATGYRLKAAAIHGAPVPGHDKK